jgi:hypothetical protein
MDSHTANEVAKGILDLVAAMEEAVENERRHSSHRSLPQCPKKRNTR